MKNELAMVRGVAMGGEAIDGDNDFVASNVYATIVALEMN